MFNNEIVLNNASCILQMWRWKVEQNLFAEMKNAALCYASLSCLAISEGTYDTIETVTFQEHSITWNTL